MLCVNVFLFVLVLVCVCLSYNCITYTAKNSRLYLQYRGFIYALNAIVFIVFQFAINSISLPAFTIHIHIHIHTIIIIINIID